MKIKKLAALALSCAMVITGGALFAACGDDDKDDDKKGGFVEDTRIWYAVGKSEKGTLKDNGEWKPQVAAETLTFKRDTTKTDENVFTLKMDIYAGDGFKFVYKTKADETFASDDEAWARQVGIHNFTNVEGEGAAAVVKIGEDTVFTTKDGIDANNLYCAKGQDGKYTFTLKTFPEKGSEEKVEFSVTKDEAITIPYDMYVYGDMNDFGWKDKADYAMTSSNGVWSTFLTVKDSDLKRDATGKKVGKDEATYAAIQLVNEGEGAAAGDAKKFALTPAADDKFLKVTDSAQGEINLLPAGEWKITFTEDGKVVSIKESSYVFIIGSINNWNENDATSSEYAFMEQDDGSWTATITVEKDEEIKSFNTHLTDNKYSNGDNAKLTAGTWAVKYDPETNTIQVEKFGYYIVGAYADMDNITGWGNGLMAGKAVALEDKGDGVYSADVELVVDNEVKVVFGAVMTGPKDWYGVNGSDANYKVTEAGTYTVTATVSDGSVLVTVAKKA